MGEDCREGQGTEEGHREAGERKAGEREAGEREAGERRQGGTELWQRESGVLFEVRLGRDTISEKVLKATWPV